MWKVLCVNVFFYLFHWVLLITNVLVCIRMFMDTPEDERTKLISCLGAFRQFWSSLSQVNIWFVVYVFVLYALFNIRIPFLVDKHLSCKVCVQSFRIWFQTWHSKEYRKTLHERKVILIFVRLNRCSAEVGVQCK